ncbi:F-box protein At4g35930-like [Phoenix dactylifera]|uniref:F-box protein At4g35930-like n=1 Tax=Phoenix dactylifera TaxID=42345 RepID=A0A8B9A6K3_PHODC|nr:F-box protein At4g35930-like [Phoenix dactylifera]XP_017701671.2 F-box protein At4g35930-like [Phoenix dactylifera]XP_038982276.1 F-box protein At4g35930-like [Phoenix dactylifera]XP_038982277.1 F-box protein At4g35930-like [Phoenix dactylifera]XP_038982278.1 F-box protein At4g35930-like [Phoenix dactylifera]XP_038982279.1 F-box protein At4g35930-like [Phoenix dactylifera]XP_038982280.1 F-box protein At4g35930-like [Phoenix dactylifera]
MSPESMAFKQKKRVKNARNKYLKPGALAQLRDSRTTTRSCTDIGKKRVVLDSEKAKLDLLHQEEVTVHSNTAAASPIRTNFQPMVDGNKQQKLPETPKTPEGADCDNQSSLESLPVDLLVKILCHLHHDQLKAVFHVSQRIRTAVLLARQLHFNFTTPDRSRQEMLRTKTPLPTEHWPFVSKGGGKGICASSPHTPKAPRPGPRPPRLHMMDMKQIAAVLFQESVLPSKCMVPPGLPRPVLKPMASNRVLIYEDELCQAVAQNKLR